MAARDDRAGEARQPYTVETSAPKWSAEQLAVIEAPENDGLLVSAGPGTGKTAIACARIAHLVSKLEIEPSKIWLVSFTRTAVHELRQRIAAFVSDPSKTYGIKIATIDSHAWAIHSGFSQDASLAGSFDKNIEHVIKLIKSHEGVFEYLGNLQHLFIDEAQDVVNVRCELMLELINALPETCGVTVLADDAQSIYGFSEDEVVSVVKGTLPDQIRKHLSFKELHLTEIYRTSDPTLRHLFGEGRGILLRGAVRGKARLEKVREFILETNHGAAGQYKDDIESLPEEVQDAFLLFRKRGDALQASSYLHNRSHRLRMSGLPISIHEWIGQLFWDWNAPEIDHEEFEKRWKKRVGKHSHHKPDSAWRVLVRLCGISEKRVSIHRLATRLGGGSPPIDLCDPDLGPGGPVVGTIHGAKGREAGEVRLYLPPTASGEMDEAKADEEARILFVGATRARHHLRVGQGPTRVFAQRTNSGRAYTPYWFGDSPWRACVEIGRAGDVDAEGLAGRKYYPSAELVHESQKQIAGLASRLTDANATRASSAFDWRYAVREGVSGMGHLCYLSPRVNNELWEIAKKIDEKIHKGRIKSPPVIKYLRTFGIRTYVVAPDNPARQALHAPWCDSGFILAPNVIGYSMIYFWR